MTKTILELADELEVTKQAIQYQIKKIDTKYLDKREDGAYLILSEGQNIIRKNMGFEVKNGDKKTDKDQQKTSKKTDKILLDDTVTILQSELEEKNIQIDKLQELLKEQQNLLSQQQQLSLQSNQQIQHLQLGLSKETIKENNENLEDQEPVKKKKDQEVKKGFFRRLFNL